MFDRAASPATPSNARIAGARYRSQLVGRLRAVPDIAWVAALSLMLTGLWLWRTDIGTYGTFLFAQPWDHHKYIEMATSNPFDFHIAPYCWRVGTPLLAKLLPLGLQASFLSIAFVSVWTAGVLSWLLAREFAFSRPVALSGTLFFHSLQWGPKFFLFDFWLPDATIFLLVMLAVLLLARGNMLAFVIVTTLGVAAKESMLFVLPLAYTFSATRLADRRAARRTVILAMPAVLMFAGIRLAIPAWNDDPAYVATLPEKLWLVRDGGPEYDLFTALRQETRNRIAGFGTEDLKTYSVRTFGPAMTLLPLFALRRNAVWFIRFLPFMLLVASQMLFGHDTERYLILAFPAVLVMALNGVDNLSERFNLPAVYWSLVPAVLIVFELALVDPFFLQLRFHALALIIALLAIITLARWRAN